MRLCPSYDSTALHRRGRHHLLQELLPPRLRALALHGRGETLEDLMIDAAIGAVDSIPRQRRRDLDLVQEAVRRAVRGAANEAWGKKPLVTVFVTR